MVRKERSGMKEIDLDKMTIEEAIKEAINIGTQIGIELKKTFIEKYTGKHKLEYMKLKLNELRQELKNIQEQYKDDPQGLSMFSQGYIEHIKQLEQDINSFERG